MNSTHSDFPLSWRLICESAPALTSLLLWTHTTYHVTVNNTTILGVFQCSNFQLFLESSSLSSPLPRPVLHCTLWVCPRKACSKSSRPLLSVSLPLQALVLCRRSHTLASLLPSLSLLQAFSAWAGRVHLLSYTRSCHSKTPLPPPRPQQ